MSHLNISCQAVSGFVQASLLEQNFGNKVGNTSYKLCYKITNYKIRNSNLTVIDICFMFQLYSSILPFLYSTQLLNQKSINHVIYSCIFYSPSLIFFFLLSAFCIFLYLTFSYTRALRKVDFSLKFTYLLSYLLINLLTCLLTFLFSKAFLPRFDDQSYYHFLNLALLLFVVYVLKSFGSNFCSL